MFIKKISKSLLALLLVFSMLALCACGTSKNGETGTTEPIPQTPEEKFEKAGKDITNNIIDPVFDLLETINTAPQKMSEKSNLQMQVRLGETIAQSLLAMTGVDFSWINDASIDLSYAMQENLTGVNMGLSYQNKDLIGISGVIDNENSIYYISIPQLFEKSLKMDMSAYMDVNMVAGLSAFENLPDTAKIKALIVKYINMLLESVNNIEESQGVLEIDGVSENCTILTIKLSAKDIAGIAKNVLESAAADQDLKTVIEELAAFLSEIFGVELDANGRYETFKSSIAEIIADIDASVAEMSEEKLNETLLTLTEYIDSNYDLTGMKLEIAAEDEPTSAIFFGSAEADGKTRISAYIGNTTVKSIEINAAIDETDTSYKASVDVLSNSESMASIKIDLKNENNAISGDMKLSLREIPTFAIGVDLTKNEHTISGTLEFFVKEESFLFLDLENLDTKALEEGELKGIISIAPSKGIMNKLGNMLSGSGIPSTILSAFSLTFKFEDNSATFSLMNGAEEYFALIFTMGTEEKDVVVSIPANTTENMNMWANSMNPELFFTNIQNANLPQEILQMIYMLFYSAM